MACKGLSVTRIAVIGSRGQVGGELVRALSGAHTVIAFDRNMLDLTDPPGITRAVATAGADLVVNAAAYTAVDRAEDEPDVAAAVNAAGAGHVAQATARLGVPIIHFSTDYVFAGARPLPYAEDDHTGPISVYGRTKLEGERLVAVANARHVILRAAWVFSPHGHNFVRTMLRLASERPRLCVVDDQRGSPTSAADLAVVVAQLIPRLLRRDVAADAFGIFHAVNAGATTWCGFARAIMADAAHRGAPSVPIDAIRTADYPTKARRPACAVLSTRKLARVHGVTLRPWTDALSACLDELIGPARTGSLDAVSDASRCALKRDGAAGGD